MSLEILHRTPLWVWALFALLLYRGIRALRPRRLSVSRTFLLPVLFLVWVLAFASKFVLMTMLARDHGLAADAAFSAAFGGVSGLVDGMFWGGTLSQVWQLRHLALPPLARR